MLLLLLLIRLVFSASCNLITNTPRATGRRTSAVRGRRKVNHLQVLPPCVWDGDIHTRRAWTSTANVTVNGCLWDELKGQKYLCLLALRVYCRDRGASVSQALQAFGDCTGAMAAGRGGRAAIHTVHCHWAFGNAHSAINYQSEN